MGGTITITPDATPAAPAAPASPVTITPDQPTPEQTLSRTNANMAAAMSGQPQSTPEDQANFDQGKKAGTIQGGVDIAAGALAGPSLGALDTALKYLGFGAKVAKAAEPVATGLLDQYGSPILRAVEPEVRPIIEKLLSHQAVQKGLQEAGKEILKGSLYGIGGAGAYKVLHHLLP